MQINTFVLFTLAYWPILEVERPQLCRIDRHGISGCGHRRVTPNLGRASGAKNPYQLAPLHFCNFAYKFHSSHLLTHRLTETQARTHTHLEQTFTQTQTGPTYSQIRKSRNFELVAEALRNFFCHRLSLWERKQMKSRISLEFANRIKTQMY